MTRRLPPDPVFKAAVGQQRGGAWLLLKRIAHWERYAQVWRDGRLWVAKDRDEWSAELGVTERTIKFWLDLLRDRQLVVTKQGFFAGRCVGHVRLTRRAQKAIWGKLLSTRAASRLSTRADSKVATRVASKLAAHNTGTSEEDDTGTSGAAAQESPGEEESAEVRGGESVEEVQARIRDRRARETSDDRLAELEETAADSGKVSDLERMWRCCWLRTQGVFYRPWTPTEKGQARRLMDELEEPALTVAFIRAAVERWSEMTAAVIREAAIFRAPSRPSVGWLLRFRTDAWAWYDRLTGGADATDAEEALRDL